MTQDFSPMAALCSPAGPLYMSPNVTDPGLESSQILLAAVDGPKFRRMESGFDSP
jgi:hypothetical protein